MSLIDKGHNEVADTIYREVVEEGRVPTINDVTALTQEVVRLSKKIKDNTKGSN